MSLNLNLNLISSFLLFSLISPSLSKTLPDQQTLLPVPTSPPSTIPSFPEQSAVSACSVNLPSSFFPAVRSSCIDAHGSSSSFTPLHRSRCCPVLAAWLYSSSASSDFSSHRSTSSSSYDMPLLPDDSETCVDQLESAMSERGLQLPRPNATCDVVYCYCGIRLHQMTCPEAFYVDSNGDLTGDRRVQRLQTDCSGDASNVGLSGCSKCLNSLNKLNRAKSGNSTAMSERTSKMRLKDCQLMGLTWLLAKNRSKYMHTVTSVLRVIMLSESHNGTSPKSCSLNSDGMPLPVDSSEITGASYSNGSSPYLFMVFLCLMYINLSEFL